MSLDEKLDQLAERDDDPEATIARQRGQDVEAFQATSSRVRRYAEQGYLIIVSEKSESNSGQRLTVRFRVRLTPAGRRAQRYPRRQKSWHLVSGITLHAEYEAQGLAQVSESGAQPSPKTVTLK